MNIAWLAGFFDGEGYVGTPVNGPSGYRTVVVQICQKNEAIIREIHEAYPEGHVRVFAPKDAWYFSTSGARPSERILKDMLPFLKVKRERTLLALEFIADVKKGRRRNAKGQFCRQGGRKFIPPVRTKKAS